MSAENLPDPPELQARLRKAESATDEAGRLLAGFFRRPVQSRFKRGDSMVSDVDHAAEELLRTRIGADFPRDAILGEETGYHASDSPWLWTLDPLDGTQNFLAGVPLFTVAVALLYERSPVVAVVNDPMRGEVYSAVRGGGARRNGVELRANQGPIGRSSLIAVRHRFLRQQAAVLYDLLPTRKFRSLGSICLELAYVASGALDLVIADRPHLWDIAPGVLLVEEAGGLVRSFAGDAVFPLTAYSDEGFDRRFHIAAGGPSAVAEIVNHLGKAGLTP